VTDDVNDLLQLLELERWMTSVLRMCCRSSRSSSSSSSSGGGGGFSRWNSGEPLQKQEIG
jgi:hypothetical protein